MGKKVVIHVRKLSGRRQNETSDNYLCLDAHVKLLHSVRHSAGEPHERGADARHSGSSDTIEFAAALDDTSLAGIDADGELEIRVTEGGVLAIGRGGVRSWSKAGRVGTRRVDD